MNDLRVTQAEFASMHGWNKSHVTRLKQAGRLVIDDRGYVIVEASIEKIAATATQQRPDATVRHAANRLASEGASEPDSGPQIDERTRGNTGTPTDAIAGLVASAADVARRRDMVDLAMKVRKNNTECGLLVPAEEVTMATARVMTMLAQDLDAMGAELCVPLGTCKDEAERKQSIDEYTSNLRAKLAKAFAKEARRVHEQEQHHG